MLFNTQLIQSPMAKQTSLRAVNQICMNRSTSKVARVDRIAPFPERNEDIEGILNN